VNSPSGSTLQCDTWLWDDKPLNSPGGNTCNVTRSSGIMTLNSPGGSTLQCGRWLWDDIPLNSPKRPPYWNSTSGFDFNHIRESTCHSAPVSKLQFTKLLSFPENHVFAFQASTSKMAFSAILDFSSSIMHSLKSRCMTSYRSLIETIALNCLVFEKIVFFCILATDRQTNEQMDSTDALSRSRYREWRHNNDKCQNAIDI